MKNFYQSFKVKVNAWMDRVILFCSKKMVQFNLIRQPRLRRIVISFFRWIGSLALFVKQFPRLEAYTCQHALGKFIFLGVEKIECVLFLRQIDHELNDVDLEPVGRVYLWALPKQVDRWLAEGVDAVVCDLSRTYPLAFKTNYQIKTPIIIEQVIYLPDSAEAFLSGSKFRELRRSIYQAQRSNITYRFSQEKSDFDNFHYHMYLPYIQKRHGDFADINNYEAQWKEFQKGGLVMVCKDDQTIAGSLVQSAEDFAIGLEGGVLDVDPDLLPKKVYSLMFWACIEWALAKGAKRFDLGTTYASRNNGIFRFKKSFTARVESQPRFVFPNRMILMNHPSAGLVSALNETGWIYEKNGKHFGVILDESQDLAHDGYAKDLDRAVGDGLDGIVVLKPKQKQFIEAPDKSSL